LFLVSSLLSLFGSVQQIKLAIRQLLGTRKYSPSFRMVSYKGIYALKIAEIDLTTVAEYVANLL